MDRLRLLRSRRPALAIALLLALAAVAVTILIAGRGSGTPDLRAAKAAERDALGASDLRQRFAVLSSRHSNKCGLRPESLKTIAVNGRLQGSCCSPMDYDSYVSQISGLKRYASVSEIPADPYDIPVTLAKRLLDYEREITLTQAQQAVYKRAVKLSDEHGPCCCHCWRWEAFEGQAKFLIARRRYDAAQIARVWNLEDGCGGKGESHSA